MTPPLPPSLSSSSSRRTPARGRSPGRPREFDMDQALDRAIAVFRERGYHAASIADLKAALGLTPGSLYKAFKDKRAIYLAAFGRYTILRAAALTERLAGQTTGRARLEAIVRGHLRLE